MSEKEDSARKPNLGMGLSALFGDSRSLPALSVQNKPAKQYPEGTVVVQEIMLSQIEPNNNQPRKDFDEEELFELASSIKQNGVLQPILLRTAENDRYQIIAGERRFRATDIAKLKTIPAIIIDGRSEEEVLHMALLENIQRADLSVIEEGYAYKNLVDNFNCTHEKIAKTLGKSRAHITNAIRILKLPKEVLDMISGNQLTFGHAKILSGAENPAFWAQVVVEKNLTVRGLEDLVGNKIKSENNDHISVIKPPKQKSKTIKHPQNHNHHNDSSDKDKQALDILANQVTKLHNIAINIERDEDEDGAFYLIIKCKSKADTEDLLKKLK